MRVFRQQMLMAFVTVLDLSTDISVHRFNLNSAPREVQKMMSWRRLARLHVARGVVLGVLALLPGPDYRRGYYGCGG